MKNPVAKHNHNKGGRHMDDKDRPRETNRSLMDEASYEWEITEMKPEEFDEMTSTEVEKVVEELFFVYTGPNMKFGDYYYTAKDWRHDLGVNVPQMLWRLGVHYFLEQFEPTSNIGGDLERYAFEWYIVHSALKKLKDTEVWYNV